MKRNVRPRVFDPTKYYRGTRPAMVRPPGRSKDSISLVAFSEDTVADAGAGMREGAFDEAGPRGPAGPRHGR